MANKNRKSKLQSDSELIKTKEILIDSFVKILKTTNNLSFKCNILAKLKLNHLSNDCEIEESLSNLLDNYINCNSDGKKRKRVKKDDEFEQLNFNQQNSDSSSNLSSIQSQNSIESDFSDLANFEEKTCEHVNIDDFDLLGIQKYSSKIDKDDYESLLDF